MKSTTILERTYTDMLEVLPPEAFQRGPEGSNIKGFLVGEPSSHDPATGLPRFGSYFAFADESFIAGPNMTVEEFKAAMLLTEQELRDDETTPDDVETELDLIDNYSKEAIDAYHALGIESNKGLDDFEEAYAGQFDSDEDFAQNMAEDIGAINKDATWPNNCIDWEYAARELMYDYSASDGHYFRNL